jgi:DNA-binding NarL/FixJ family response regulator
VSEKIHILIADDHAIVRQGLRATLERESDFTIIAEAENGADALRLIENLKPAIAVLDVDMPEMNGFDVLRRINEKNLSTAIVFLTVHREGDLLDEALKLGAKGFVLKDSAIADIAASVRAVLKGEFFTSPAMTSYLVNRSLRPKSGDNLEKLTPTERRVLKLLAEYKTNKEIAAEMFVSPRTVETHRANIALKLNLRGSHALMKFALSVKDEL